MNNAILHTTSIYDYETKKEDYIIEWFEEKRKKQFPVFVAVVENEIAGYATYDTFRQKEGYKFTVEHSVYVHPNFQKLGIGTKLTERLIHNAREQNLHSMIAGIDAENTVSIALHKKLGFEQVGYIKESAYKFDRWLDLVFMQLLLK